MMLTYVVPRRQTRAKEGDVASKETMKFGSMKEMAGAGLALLNEQDAIDQLFFDHGDAIAQYIKTLERLDVLKVQMLRPGVVIYPPQLAFRNRSRDCIAIIISGEFKDEVFYLVLTLVPTEKVPGGIAPGGPRMEIYLRDGCGKPGVESALYIEVLCKFRSFLRDTLHCTID